MNCNKLGVLTIVTKTKTVTALTNLRALLVSKNAEKNLKTITKTTESATNYTEFFSKICFLFLEPFYTDHKRLMTS